MAKVSAQEKALKTLEESDEGVRYYFDLLEEILTNVSSPEPALAYCFQRIEAAQRVSLYVLLMRKYRTDTKVAWNVIDNLDLTRKNYPEHYATLTGHQLDDGISKSLKRAMTIRDRITHGKSATRIGILEAVND